MAGQQAGVTVGSYRIIEQIGQGGMATVYKAYQPSMERYIALKVLPQHYANDPRFVKRFLREAKTIANLEHRNILPVYDYGEDKSITYLAMRYLEGGTLKDILALGRLTLADAARLLEQAAHALDYAHRQGVIHRDVKPANIMVDDEGWCYLTDFGIAKVLDSTSELTAGAIGTPAYMAPEQSLGQTVDGRADIYALGVILYELATGQVPFTADTPMAVALAHIHNPLPLPREVDASVPEPIERVLLKALAKDPDDRYQTASEFTDTLGDAIREASVDATNTRLQVLAAEARDSRELGSQALTYDPFVDPLASVTDAEAAAASSGAAPARGSLPVWVWPLIAILGIGVVAGAILLGTGAFDRPDEQAVSPPEEESPSAEIIEDEPANADQQFQELAPSGDYPITIIWMNPDRDGDGDMCTPKEVREGELYFGFGAGCGPDETCWGLADEFATFTIDDEPIAPASITGNGDPNVDENGRTVDIQNHENQYGLETWAHLPYLAPGEYEIYSRWIRRDGTEVRICTLTVFSEE